MALMGRCGIIALTAIISGGCMWLSWTLLLSPGGSRPSAVGEPHVAIPEEVLVPKDPLPTAVTRPPSAPEVSAVTEPAVSVSTEAKVSTEVVVSTRPPDQKRALPYCLQPDDVPPPEEWRPIFIEELYWKKGWDWPATKRIVELGWTVDDMEKAKIVLICCGPIDRLLALPPRSAERPYLCYDCAAKLGLAQATQSGGDCIRRNTCPDLKQLLLRKDILYASPDLRLHDLLSDDGPLMLGITYAHMIPNPEQKPMSDPPEVHTPPKYFLTFQGKWNFGDQGSSWARLNLAWKTNSSVEQAKPPEYKKRVEAGLAVQVDYIAPPGVVLNFAGPKMGYKNKKTYQQLFDSAYGLVIHGHGRWSYRLMETMHGGAIPVIMSDGWNLPYEEIIDWEKISLRRPESMSLDPTALVESLPRDPDAIEEMRKGVREVYARHLSTFEKRAVTMLRSVVLRGKQQGLAGEPATLRSLAESVP